MSAPHNSGEPGADGLRHFPQIDRSPSPQPSSEIQQDTPGLVSAYTRGSIVPQNSPAHIAPAFQGTTAPEIKLSPYEARQAAKFVALQQRPARPSFAQKALQPEQPRNPAPRLEPQNPELLRPVHRMVRNDLRQLRASQGRPLLQQTVRSAAAPPIAQPVAPTMRTAFQTQQPALVQAIVQLPVQAPAVRTIPAYARVTPNYDRPMKQQTAQEQAGDRDDYQAVAARMKTSPPRPAVNLGDDFARNPPKAKRHL